MERKINIYRSTCFSLAWREFEYGSPRQRKTKSVDRRRTKKRMLYLVCHLLSTLHARIIAYSTRYKITPTVRACFVWKIKRTSWNVSSPPENWTILRRWNNEIIRKMVKSRGKEWSINRKRCTRRKEQIVQFVRKDGTNFPFDPIYLR